MGPGQRLLGDGRGHAQDHSGSLIRRARLYETGAAIGFAGRRTHVYDRLITRSGVRPATGS